MMYMHNHESHPHPVHRPLFRMTRTHTLHLNTFHCSFWEGSFCPSSKRCREIYHCSKPIHNTKVLKNPQTMLVIPQHFLLLFLISSISNFIHSILCGELVKYFKPMMMQGNLFWYKKISPTLEIGPRVCHLFPPALLHHSSRWSIVICAGKWCYLHIPLLSWKIGARGGYSVLWASTVIQSMN